MLGYVKKAKDIYSWYSFGSNIVGILGLGGFVAGITTTVIGVVGGAMKGVPWPIVVMAGFCTLVAAMFLAALPVFVSAAIRIAPEQKSEKEPPRPNYEAFKHVDQFTLREAAFLWSDQAPKKMGAMDVNVSGWLRAFKSAVTQGKLELVVKADFALGPYGFEEVKRGERNNPSEFTTVTKDSLVKFAIENKYKPKFLFAEEASLPRH